MALGRSYVNEITQWWRHQPSNSFDYTTVDGVTHLFKANAKALGNSFDYTTVDDVNIHGNDVDVPTSRAN